MTPAVEAVLGRLDDGYRLSVTGQATTVDIARDALAGAVADIEAEHRPRWVWADTRSSYGELLRRGVTVERCTDLWLSHRILRHARATAGSALATADGGSWDGPQPDADRPATLLDALEPDHPGFDEVVAEATRQREAIATADRPAQLTLLLQAESAGGLVATEMHHHGLPWSREIHETQLRAELGERPPAGQRPPVLARLADEVRTVLSAPQLNPDSPADLLRALRRAGFDVPSTRKWHITSLPAEVSGPLLEFKRLSRLHAANGWQWLDTWVADGRFHPDYLPGGVVTGRWATRGGGALQLPKSLRAAVVPDQGWKLVVGDAAQLEPRILAAMSADPAMARACAGADLYQALVDQGVVATRQQAKIGMLAAMYGGTTGEAAEVLPRMRQAFPRALELVDEAARAGERFEQVETWLGRTSPVPGDRWVETQQRAYGDFAGDDDVRAARSQARDWGRFTRNFVVQGTAAEWALCWMASLRRRLRPMGPLGGRPELVYFLHDELTIHAPAPLAEAAVEAMHAAAAEAGRLMFGDTSVETPVIVTVIDR